MALWDATSARELAAHLMGGMGSRWAHVAAVGTAGERLGSTQAGNAEFVAPAAWLHDVGYSPRVPSTGFHPLDGARFLRDRGAPLELVSLVAYHSGAEFEAQERGLADDLAMFERPDPVSLDMLTLVDMTHGPTGHPVSVDARLQEILSRYRPGDPVHRAVTRSSGYLQGCCARAMSLLVSSDERVRSAQ